MGRTGPNYGKIRPNLDKRRRLCFVGSSHCTRIYKRAQQMSEIKREFFVEDFTVPGAEFSKLPELPDPKLFANNDVIILWCFGNSYIKSKPYRLPNKRFPNEQFINHRNEVITTKKIHLPEFVPASNTTILNEFETA